MDILYGVPPAPSHECFQQAESIEHFVELLKAYHAGLMLKLPENQRYEFISCDTRFSFHPIDDPDYDSDVAWGEYHFRLIFKMPPSSSEAFKAIQRDFPFIQMLSSQASSKSGEEKHETSIDLVEFPKMQAEFEKLQELNVEYLAHEAEKKVKLESACKNSTEMSNITYNLAVHQMKIHTLETEKSALLSKLTTQVDQENPFPGNTLERDSLRQKYTNA